GEPGRQPAPAPGADPIPTPVSGPVSREAGIPIESSTTAQANRRYDISGNGAAIVALTLPGFIVPGDFVSVRGTGSQRWRIVPNCCPGTTARSDMTPQAVLTSNLPGNVATGQNWTARLAPLRWHWMASSQDGSVLVAAENPGNLHVSTDAGVTWAVSNTPPGQAWISASVKNPPYPYPGAGNVNIVAVAYGGAMYRSTDAGRTWNPLVSADPGVNLGNREWQSVTSDQYGLNLAAAILNGPIYRIGNPGASTGWQAGTLEGSGTVLERPWRALASSADGTLMAAASESGELFLSTNRGATWSRRSISVGSSLIERAWYRMAMSGDGKTIAIAGRANSGLYVSRDSGVSWAQAPAPIGRYTALAISADGQVIGTTRSNDSLTGGVQVSRNGGASFSVLALPGQDSNWRAFAMSADGNQFVVAAGTLSTTPGQLYTSLGNRTSIGSAGYIEGGPKDFVELEFLGNARFRVRAFEGGPFTVR
ncbi:MAG: hypothetical protein LH479_12995, partial [Polaromonas sp.]|nr:hypothetical protein [Polaromonas sp.]